MKYFYLVLVACSYLTGIQSDDCSLQILPDSDYYSYLCFTLQATPLYPSLTNCSEYFNCSYYETDACDTSAPYYDPSTQTCTTDSLQCLNGNQHAYTLTCQNSSNVGDLFPFTGYDWLWVYCSDSGAPAAAQCQSSSATNQCVTDSSTNCTEVTPINNF